MLQTKEVISREQLDRYIEEVAKVCLLYTSPSPRDRS